MKRGLSLSVDGAAAPPSRRISPAGGSRVLGVGAFLLRRQLICKESAKGLSVSFLQKSTRRVLIRHYHFGGIEDRRKESTQPVRHFEGPSASARCWSRKWLPLLGGSLRQLCDCHARGWLGELEPFKCPSEKSGLALGRQRKKLNSNLLVAHVGSSTR